VVPTVSDEQHAPTIVPPVGAAPVGEAVFGEDEGDDDGGLVGAPGSAGVEPLYLQLQEVVAPKPVFEVHEMETCPLKAAGA